MYEELIKEFSAEDLALTKEELEVNLPANMRGLDVAFKSGDDFRIIEAARATLKCWKKVFAKMTDRIDENII